MKLVDASLLIDYARGDDAAIAYLAANDKEEIGASTIVLSELYRGLMITQEMTQEEAIRREHNLGVSDLPDSRWAHLDYVEGDIDAYRSMLERQKTVEYFDLNPVDDRSFYTYIVFQKRPSDERFAEAFQENGVIVVPPVETDRNGVTFTLVGPHEALQALLEDLPEGMDTEILRVGEFDQHHGALAGRLTSRQREAVSAALAVDYYGVPHDATLADVADELGCTVGTVSTLLRRAERAVMEAVVVR